MAEARAALEAAKAVLASLADDAPDEEKSEAAEAKKKAEEELSTAIKEAPKVAIEEAKVSPTVCMSIWASHSRRAHIRLVSHTHTTRPL